MVNPVPKPDLGDTVGNQGIGGRRGGGSAAKRSGTYFEREAEKFFEDSHNTAAVKRVIGSGAFGKIYRDPRLLGDLHIAYKILPKALLAECKFGYKTGKTQMSIRKEWLDKAEAEAKLANKWPVLIMKFKGTRGPNSKVIILTWETWEEIMAYLTKKVQELQEEIDGATSRSNAV